MLNDDCIEYFTGVYASCDESGAKAQAQAVDRMLDMARGVGCGPRKPSEQLLQSSDDADLLAYAPTGYFMGSTTEIDASSRLENVLAMMEVSWGHKPEGAHPDILRQIAQRKAK
jgi:hypothetical protein